MPKGLYANIHAKRKRIKAGSGETMRKAGTKGRPTSKAFKKAAKTAKKKRQQLHITGSPSRISTWTNVFARPIPLKHPMSTA